MSCSCAVCTTSAGGGPSALTSSDTGCSSATSICASPVVSVQPSRWCGWPSSGSGGMSCSASTFSTKSRFSCGIIASSWRSSSAGSLSDAARLLEQRRGHHEVDAVRAAVDVLVDPRSSSISSSSGVKYERAEHAHPARLAHRGDDVAAVAEGEDRELDAEPVADGRCMDPTVPGTGSTFPGTRRTVEAGVTQGDVAANTSSADTETPRAAETAARAPPAGRGRDRARRRGRLRRGPDARRRRPGPGRARHALPPLLLEGSAAPRRARGPGR